jgi:hypothetical protein
MGISFPNATRSFDAKNRCVRFTGYDGMFEIKFFVASEVLSSETSHRTANEADLLASFDALRARILKAAVMAYGKSKSSAITLDLGHFR